MRRYIFAPKMVFVGLTAVAVALFSWLGVWQIHRADEKRSMLAHFATMRDMPPVWLKETEIQPIENYQPIMIEGAYDNRSIFFLDNQFYQHQVGYEVIEPFVSTSGKMILVSRGWVKASQDRQQLPEISFPQGKKMIRGTAYFPSKSLIILGSNVDELNNHSDWPKRIEKLDIAEIKTQLEKKSGKDMAIYPFILRLDSKDADGFVRDWPIVAMPPVKHIGYAVQWFAMAAAVLIIFVVLNVKKIDAKNNEKKTTE